MAQGLFETTLHECGEASATAPRATSLDTIRTIVESAVSVVFSIEVERMQSGSRGQAPVALARQIAMYLAHCALGLSHADIGRMFGRDRTTVSHACHIVEDRRDDQTFDRTLSNLEEIVARLATLAGCRGAYLP